MDGLASNEGVIIIAATNRPGVARSSFIKTRKIDRQVVVSNPDIMGEKILKVHVKKIKMAPDVNSNNCKRGTPGFSGADRKYS